MGKINWGGGTHGGYHKLYRIISLNLKLKIKIKKITNYNAEEISCIENNFDLMTLPI